MPYLYPDPIHGRIELPDSLQALAQTRPLARIRNVRQLGLTTVSYPGTVHTRFEHSLGTAAVMKDLLDQFGVRDAETREANIRAALLSEIGALPFSANTAAIFREVGVSKDDMYALMYQTYLRKELNLSANDELILLDPEVQRSGWFRGVPGVDEFKSLTPVNLASRIDYVLRDGHYSGRYREGFDYRYFRSIDPLSGAHARSEIVEALGELHRAVHSLNAVYGDIYRRFLTQVLIRLVHRLRDLQGIDVRTLIVPETFVDLDDDTFMAYIKAAVDGVGQNDSVVQALYSAVARSVQPRMEERPIRTDEIRLEAKDIEVGIAKESGLDKDVVFVLTEPHQTSVGFRLFGKDYASYREAVASSEFQQLTGLREASDKVGLEAGDTIRYFIVQ